MKKTLKKFVSLFTCLALLLSVLLYGVPLRSSAASAGHISLRIEGEASEIFGGSVPFTAGQSVTDILNGLYSDDKISKPNLSSGYLNSFGDGSDSKKDIIPTGNAYLKFYYNDASSSQGVSAVYPNDGDNVVIALAKYDSSTYADLTYYPVVTVSNASPAIGSDITVHVKAYYTDSSFSWATIANYEGADVTFNGSYVGKTDSSGNIKVMMPVATGTYNLQVGNYPSLVRTGNIPISVGVSGLSQAQPTHNDFTTATLAPVTFTAVPSSDSSKKYSYLSSGYTSNLRDSYSHLYQLNIPFGTILSGSASWDGTFITPTPVYNLSIPDAYVRMAVQAGSLKEDLQLSQFATIILPAQSGKLAGYFDAAGAFHSITKLTTNAAPTNGSDGYYDDNVNNKLIIYTKHFSKFVAYVPASNVSTTDSIVSGAIAGATGYLQKNESSDWSAFALASAGYPVPSDYLGSVTQTLTGNGGSFDAPVSLAKTVIALRAAGADPTNFDGYNLVEKLYNYNGLDQSTLNGPIYALLALDSGKYTVPGTALWNDLKLISLILGRQNPNGGFSLSKGAASDPDITAMAITALAPHLDDSSVAQAVNSAVAYLSSTQAADGGYVPSGSTSEASESISQVVIALSSAGIDPLTDSRFVKKRKVCSGCAHAL